MNNDELQKEILGWWDLVPSKNSELPLSIKFFDESNFLHVEDSIEKECGYTVHLEGVVKMIMLDETIYHIQRISNTQMVLVHEEDEQIVKRFLRRSYVLQIVYLS